MEKLEKIKNDLDFKEIKIESVFFLFYNHLLVL